MRSSGERQSARHSHFSDAAYDDAFRSELRSDVGFIIARAVMVLVVLFFSARAIVTYDLSPGFLLLPVAFELLCLVWVGLALYPIVSCSAFRKTYGNPLWPIGVTLLMALVISFVLATSPDTDMLQYGQVVPGWINGWNRVVETGLHYALAMELATLLFASGLEIFRWRKSGGQFVWASAIHIGLRLAAFLLAGIAAVFVFPPITALLGAFDVEKASAWTMLAFLIVVELVALWIGVKVHRKVQTEKVDVL
ncbi:MAG: hypothetical protein AAGA23_11010 [Pseudomonadota bacterium]